MQSVLGCPEPAHSDQTPETRKEHTKRRPKTAPWVPIHLEGVSRRVVALPHDPTEDLKLQPFQEASAVRCIFCSSLPGLQRCKALGRPVADGTDFAFALFLALTVASNLLHLGLATWHGPRLCSKSLPLPKNIGPRRDVQIKHPFLLGADRWCEDLSGHALQCSLSSRKQRAE